MAMVELAAVVRRDVGKGANRKRRAAGRIPGIIYGSGLPTRVLEFERRELEQFVATARRGTIVVRMSVSDGGATAQSYAVLKDVQTSPVGGRIVHVDFYEVATGQKFRVEVPVRLRGKAAGIEVGGILEQIVRSLEVECTPDCVPEQIEIDVTALGIGDAVHLSDLSFPAGVRPVERDGGTTIAAVSAPKAEEAKAAPAEAAEGAEAASVAEAPGKEKEKEREKEREK